MSTEILISLIIFLPLVGGLSDFLLSEEKRSVSPIFVGGALIFSLYIVLTLDEVFMLKWEWFDGFYIGILLDKPSAILLTLVCLISFLVHLFSIAYMKEDAGRSRYFAKLGFFTFAMLGLLIADNFILLFIFWEAVGFASYLLIGFWYEKEGVPNSARMAFMVNRVADVALLAGILMLNAQSNSLFISEFSGVWFFLPSLLISIGAFGKSAQVPFSGWLVKAMVGPTPISALIHAATMVAAGVYLLYRVSPFLDKNVLIIISIVGAATALYGAISAVTQYNIKKVLAYSTISQLGYMVLGIGVGAAGASMFHLWTHAFFKAGLFLGAGAIIHYLDKAAKDANQHFDTQDMRVMGGLRNKLPWTFRSFLVCGLSLAGIPFLSGFMSKDSIILASFNWAEQMGSWAYLVPDLAIITILITAFYVGRMMIFIFWGETRAGEILSGAQFKETMHVKVPLIILSLGSLWIFYQWNPFSHESGLDQFFGSGLGIMDSFIGKLATITSIIFSVGGLLFAYFLFRPHSKSIPHSTEPISMGGRMVFNGFYLIHAYRSVGNLTYFISKVIVWVDKKILDGILHFVAMGGVVLAKVINIVDRLIVDGLVKLASTTAKALGKRLSGVHSKEIQWQITWLLLAFVLILSWILLF